MHSTGTPPDAAKTHCVRLPAEAERVWYLLVRWLEEHGIVGSDGHSDGELSVTRIHLGRDDLEIMLRAHGEFDLAARVGTVTDEDLERIGRLGAYYAWSEDVIALDDRGMGGTRACALAAIDVIECSGRELRWSRANEPSSEPDPVERLRDREIRARGARLRKADSED